MHMRAGTCGGQKRVLDPPELEYIGRCEPPKVGAGNWSPLEEQEALLPAEISLQSFFFFLSRSRPRKPSSSSNTKQAALHPRLGNMSHSCSLWGNVDNHCESHIFALYLKTASPSIIKAFYTQNLKSLNVFWAPNITIHLFIIALSNLDSPQWVLILERGNETALNTLSHTHWEPVDESEIPQEPLSRRPVTYEHKMGGSHLFKSDHQGHLHWQRMT